MNKALVELVRKYSDKALYLASLGHKYVGKAAYYHAASTAYYHAAAAAVLNLAKQ
jgi:hypothetical protein